MAHHYACHSTPAENRSSGLFSNGMILDSVLKCKTLQQYLSLKKRSIKNSNEVTCCHLYLPLVLLSFCSLFPPFLFFLSSMGAYLLRMRASCPHSWSFISGQASKGFVQILGIQTIGPFLFKTHLKYC